MDTERTLIVLKPDCVAKGLTEQVIAMIRASGLKVISRRQATLPTSLVRDHYARLENEPFFPRLMTFMTSGPAVILEVTGPGAILRSRALLGPTDPACASKDTIRGLFGESSMKNIAHASDSPENAEIELRRFSSI